MVAGHLVDGHGVEVFKEREDRFLQHHCGVKDLLEGGPGDSPSLIGELARLLNQVTAKQQHQVAHRVVGPLDLRQADRLGDRLADAPVGDLSVVALGLGPDVRVGQMKKSRLASRLSPVLLRGRHGACHSTDQRGVIRPAIDRRNEIGRLGLRVCQLTL